MNILLIEDSDILARAFVRLMKRGGHTVDHVIGIGAAFDYIFECNEGQRVKPDLVVTDREVVGGDAWEFVKQAIELGHLPDRVVYMSGNPGTSSPPQPFYQKSDDTKKLMQLIQEVAA